MKRHPENITMRINESKLNEEYELGEVYKFSCDFLQRTDNRCKCRQRSMKGNKNYYVVRNSG